MNTSYKIGLVVAVILLTLVIGYQITRPGGDAPAETAGANPADQALAQPDTAAASNTPGPTSPAVDPHSADALPPPPTQTPSRTTLADRPLIGPADFLSQRVAPNPVPQGDTTETPATPETHTPTTPPTTTPTPPTTATLTPASSPATPTTRTVNPTPATPTSPTPSITLGGRTTQTTTPSATPPANAPTARTYTVQPRDNFWVIAERLYDDPKYWSVIARANPTIDPTKIKPGDELRLPTRQQIAAFDASAEPPPVPTAPTGGRTYTVRPGDSLTAISQRVYGSARYFRRIHAANRQLIGDSPDNIREGMVLQLPIIDTSGS